MNGTEEHPTCRGVTSPLLESDSCPAHIHNYSSVDTPVIIQPEDANSDTNLIHSRTNGHNPANVSLIDSSASFIDSSASNDNNCLVGINNGIQHSISDQWKHKFGENALGKSEAEVVLRSYTRRWYIVLIYGMMCMKQAMNWNTWGPISSPAQCAIGFTNNDIFLLPAWGPIFFVVSVFPMAWVIDTKGLRSSCLLASFLVAVGTGLRCITLASPYAIWLIHLGQILIAIAGPVAMAAGPVLSAQWFEPSQRMLSTGLTFIMRRSGVALSFILGPQLVPDLNSNSTNCRTDSSGVMANSSNSSSSVVQTETDDISHYMYIEGAWCTLVFIVILIYFPSKPPTPPSKSAAVQRNSFLKGIKELASHWKYWVVTAGYALTMGGLGAWLSVLSVLLKPHNISQDDTGWMGFYMGIACIPTTLTVSSFASRFGRRKNVIIGFMCGASCVLFTMFALGVMNTISFVNNLNILYACVILAGCTLVSTGPLFNELVSDICYPVAEGVANGVISLANNSTSLVLLLAMMIPYIGTDWLVWALPALCGLCCPAMLLLRATNRRLATDEGH